MDYVITFPLLYVVLWFVVGILLSTSVYLFKPTRDVYVTNTDDKVLGGCIVILFCLVGVFALILPMISYYYVKNKT